MGGTRARWRCAAGGLLGLALVAGSPAQAATPAQAQREIDGLIAGLATSGCAFERNGDWHSADEARAHLQRKYDYLRKRGLADSAEHFIERGASRSSMSGQPYHVRCPDKPVVESGDWFQALLKRLRAAPKAASTR